MKTRLDVLKQHAETTKVLKFQGWMRELIAMLEAAEANAALNRAMEVTERERAEKVEEIAESLSNTIADMDIEYAALEAKLEKINQHANSKIDLPSKILQQIRSILEDDPCEHGRGSTDYCEPCGRINGG